MVTSGGSLVAAVSICDGSELRVPWNMNWGCSNSSQFNLLNILLKQKGLIAAL
jgi:hypothetical protein